MNMTYSPFSAIADNIFDSFAPIQEAPQDAPVRAYDYRIAGVILYDENMTPATDVLVEIFATDQLIKDVVFTDNAGIFMSDSTFDDGQYIVIKAAERRFDVFIPYTVDETMYYQGYWWFDVGTFLI